MIINRVVLMSPRLGAQVGILKSQMFSPIFPMFIWPLNTF